MRTCGALILSFALIACGGGKKSADSPGDPSDPADSSDPGDSGGSSTSCCCETYDLETPDIGYSTMSVSECKTQGGNCEDTTEYCSAD